MTDGYKGKRFKQAAAPDGLQMPPSTAQVRMVPAGGHFAKPASSGQAAPGGTVVPGAKVASGGNIPTVGGAAAGRRFASSPAPFAHGPNDTPAAGPFAPGPNGPATGSKGAPLPRAVPSPADTFANLTAAQLGEPGAAAVTASTPVPGRAEKTSRLENGSASLSTPAPAETAEFIALASASRAQQAQRTQRAEGLHPAVATQVQPPITRAAAPQGNAPAGAVAPMSPVVPPARPGGPRSKRPAGDSGEPPRRGRNVLSTILIVVGVVLLVAAAVIFIRAQIGYQQAQSSYKDLQQYAVQDSSGDNIPVVDFDELEKINPDVVGWIYIPGTVVNYPVVQTDNNSTYLYKLFDLSGNGSGSIFMDMDNEAPGIIDQQTTLYGHHMNDGSMFKVIDDTLTSQDAFDAIENVYYITRENTYRFRPLFTAQVVDEYVDARRPNFDGDMTLERYLDQTLDQAKVEAADAQERIGSTEQVLSLVTCAGEIIPRTTRAVMVCSLEETIARQ